jgi:hypothetical protein
LCSIEGPAERPGRITLREIDGRDRDARRVVLDRLRRCVVAGACRVVARGTVARAILAREVPPAVAAISAATRLDLRRFRARFRDDDPPPIARRMIRRTGIYVMTGAGTLPSSTMASGKRCPSPTRSLPRTSTESWSNSCERSTSTVAVRRHTTSDCAGAKTTV